VHAAVYIGYRSRKQAGVDPQKLRDIPHAGNYPRGRAGSGFHRPKSRHQRFLLAAILLAALMLAGPAIFSGAP
jgi:hypothetical protein